MCTTKKEDVTTATKPKVDLPKDLKRLNEGHRCKSTSKLVTKISIADLEKKITDQKNPLYSEE
jgi:hypothetical protein